MLQSFSFPSSSLESFFIGPTLSEQTPTLFYFAISAKDSLQTPPFSNFISSLSHPNLRIVSFTLPYHADIGSSLDSEATSPEKALSVWADKFSAGIDVLAPFIKEVNKALDYLIGIDAVEPGKVFAAGLSRGAFIASLLAAQNEAIDYVLGFAPLVDLSFAKEFEALKESLLVKPYHLKHVTQKLYNRKIRFYIGNHDERVNTEESFNFIYACSKTASSHRIRSAPIELIIYPSIGFKGHGTPDEIFASGADWIKSWL